MKNEKKIIKCGNCGKEIDQHMFVFSGAYVPYHIYFCSGKCIEERDPRGKYKKVSPSLAKAFYE
jgi:hypothetical protein